MLSRRKQQTTAAELSNVGGSPEERGLRKTRSGVKLNRVTRTVVGAQQPTPPAVSQKPHAICTDKTPKRLSKSNQWASTFSSPSNDELQQEIFWDLQSPTTYKSESEKRKRTGKSTVEISDIVNRIAPRDEKPTSSEVALLGMWIGENAIPCTPGVGTVRTRAKFSGTRHKIKNTDEELMKLAKQFDQNLVDAIQDQDIQDQTRILEHGDTLVNKGTGGQIHNVYSLPDKVTESGIALCLHPIKENPTPQQSQSSSQKSVDQETEAAFNALFDSSTQKCSGRLSQGLSDSSQKSSQGNSYSTETKKDIHLPPAKNIQHGAIDANLKQHSATLFSVEDQSQTAERNKAVIVPKQNVTPDTATDECCQATAIEKCSQTIPMSTNQDDFDDDWGTDLLEDDSFLMQITQNPELMKTPQNKRTPSKLNKNTPMSMNASKNIAQPSSKMPHLPQANHFQVTSNKPFEASNSIKPECEHAKGILEPVHIPTMDVTRTNFSSNSEDCRKPYKPQTASYNKSTFGVSLPSCSSPIRSNNLIQENSKNQNPAIISKENSILSDDWNDPMISDEILDMFSESDRLFEANEEEDDLLYQVCDDIEKQTQTEDIKQGTSINEAMQPETAVCKFDSSRGLVLAKPGQASHQVAQSKPSSWSTLSLEPTQRNTFSTPPETEQRNSNSAHLKPSTPPLPTSRKLGVSQNCVTFGNKTNLIPGKFNRSNSTPDKVFQSVSLVHTHNTVKPLSSSFNKALVPPPPQKFSFTKIKTSQLTSVHVDHNSSRSESISRTETHLKGVESKTVSNFSLRGNLPVSQHHSLKRQLSQSFLESAKVLAAEERSQRCSQEQIERKKREALARLKKRTQSLLKDT